MAWYQGSFRSILGLLALGLFTGVSACAGLPPTAETMPLGERVRAPSGYVEFCTRQPEECEAFLATDTPVMLTAARWRDLDEVNSHFNRKIRPVTDERQFAQREFWQYTEDAGDCEDYALTKRRALIERGWPTDALLLATARNEEGALHAVLIASTDHGDFVLDNASQFVEPWQERPYQWVARQTPGTPLAWQRVGPGVDEIATASLD